MAVVDPSRAPAAPSGARPAPPLLRVQEVAKSFGATRALRSCSLEVAAGEVHAIVGENGSGKSTLVKLLAGVHLPDAGTIELTATPSPGRRSPRSVQAAGIFTVFQEVLVVGGQSVLQNVWLGSDGLFRRSVSESAQRARASEVLGELLSAPPPLDAPVASLSLSERQACCIARALVRSPRVLILDESTSALDVATRDRLFTVVRRLCASGGAVIFISHRMGEIDELADRITVLRSGESVASFARGEATADELVRQMTGSDHLTAGTERAPAGRGGATSGRILLRTRALRLRPGGRPIDFQLAAGELVGLAGLEGHGQHALLDALRGAGAVAGDVSTGDERLLRSPQDAFAAGIAYVPRDRRDESLFPSLAISENFGVATMGADRRAGLFSRRRSAARLANYVSELAIRLGSPRQPITALSGGNQQKVVVARWLAAHPAVLLLNDPTRGVDLGAKRDLYRLLERLSSEGVGVVMLSTELDELVELMDRVLVFREGSVEAEVPRSELSADGLVRRFFGGGGAQSDAN